MTKHLTTVDEVLAELGGPVEVFKIIRLNERKKPARRTPPAIAAALWRHRKQFPYKTFRPITAALQARGATAPDRLWGF